MPAIRTARVAARRRSLRRVGLLALIAVTASSALSAAASSIDSPRAVAAGTSAPAPRTAPRTATGSYVARATVYTQPAVPRSSAVTGAGPAVGGSPSTGAAGPAAVRTLSMDAPIQGGLSARQEQRLSARLRGAHQTPTAAPTARYWTPAMGRTAVKRAESWLGLPYSWAGGSSSGPTAGRCDSGAGEGLDCHVVGFDCSGLMMYAWGPYTSLPHLAAAQRDAGAFRPGLQQLLPGDLLFFSAYLPGGTGHVAIYAGHGTVIEAPESGEVVRRSELADVLASDGTYRGSVRPLTGATPTLTGTRTTVSSAGGLVTLRGTQLAGVDTVHLGHSGVHRFVRHTDSVIVFRAPARPAGTVALTVSTSWRASSTAMTLVYATPRAATPKAPATAPAASTAPTAPSAPATPSSPTAPSSPRTPTAPRSPTAPPSSDAPTAPSSSAPSSPDASPSASVSPDAPASSSGTTSGSATSDGAAATTDSSTTPTG